jgi:glycerol-3-phosphate dehydrogenase
MGRCRGGFCGPRVSAILATELSIPSEQVTKDGGRANLIVGKTKSVVKEKLNV